MSKRFLTSTVALSALAFALVASPAAFAAQPEPHRTVSPAPVRQNLTVYQRFGIIQQTNSFDATPGANSIRLDGIAGKYEPSSLVIVSVNGLQLKVKDVSYQPANLNMQSMLASAVGSNVTVKTNAGDEISGQLLSYTDGNLIILPSNTQQSVTGPRAIKDPKEVQFTSLPAGLSQSPSLTLNADTQWGGHGDMQILYKAAGLSWSGRYAITYNELRGTVDMSCSVAISNNSGADFKDAGIKVVSGNIQDGPQLESFSARSAMAAAPAGVMADDAAVGSLGEQKIYTLAASGVDLKDGETKQVPLYQTQGVPVDRVFYIQNPHSGGNINLNANVRLVTINDQGHRLGQSLPAGSVKFYQNDPSGQLQLSGAGALKASEAGEKMLLEMGTSTDVKVTYSLVGSTPGQRNQNGNMTTPSEYRWQVTLRNFKNQDVQVKVYESAGGTTVVNSSQQFTAEGGSQFTWVRVPAGGREVTFTYTTREQN